jgi:hypothetical protein
VLSLYVIRSKDPSGGMKDIVLSFSNLAKRTHLSRKGKWSGPSSEHTLGEGNSNIVCLLMEFDIIKVYGLSFGCSTLSLQKNPIIQSKFALWHSTVSKYLLLEFQMSVSECKMVNVSRKCDCMKLLI